MQPIPDVKPGDKFVLSLSEEGWRIPFYQSVSGDSFVFLDGDTVEAADPGAVGGLWVREHRLNGSVYAPWAWLTRDPHQAFSPCRCNISIGPCRCGAFQREQKRGVA